MKLLKTISASLLVGIVMLYAIMEIAVLRLIGAASDPSDIAQLTVEHIKFNIIFGAAAILFVLQFLAVNSTAREKKKKEDVF